MNQSIIAKDVFIKEKDEYVSLLSMDKPSGLGVINKDFFNFLLNPNNILENENIDKNQLKDIFSPLVDKNLLDLSNPIFNDLDVKNNNEISKKTMSAWIHLTNQCNLDCSYCYIGKDTSKMSEDTMNNVINSLKYTIESEGIEKIGFSLAGGEPLMNFSLLKKFVEKVKSEIKIDSNFSIVTNGTLLDKEKINFFNENNFGMYVSLDGLGEDNDVQRYFKGGQGSFDKVVEGINKLKEDFKGKLTIGIVAGPGNVKGLPKLTNFLLEKGLQFKYSFYRPNENSKIDNYIFDNFQKELIQSLRESFKIVKEKAGPRFNPEKIFDKMSIKGQGGKKVCTMGEKYFAISHLGEISSCHMT